MLPQKIIAVDASTNSLAFSLFHSGRLVQYGKIRFNGTDAIYKAGDACKKSIAFFKPNSAKGFRMKKLMWSSLDG